MIRFATLLLTGLVLGLGGCTATTDDATGTEAGVDIRDTAAKGGDCCKDGVIPPGCCKGAAGAVALDAAATADACPHAGGACPKGDACGKKQGGACPKGDGCCKKPEGGECPMGDACCKKTGGPCPPGDDCCKGQDGAEK